MAMIEGLENRQLLAATITDIAADNRGEVTVTFSEDVRGLAKSSVRLFTYGADGVANTSDDVKLPNTINYISSSRKLTTRVTGGLAPNTLYRIRLQATQIKSIAESTSLDGEFNANGTSGNGSTGGNYDARFRRDTSATPRARVSTTAGIIEIRLRKDVAPTNVANFLQYADAGRYDGIFVNRSVPGFILQAGAARVVGDGADATDLAEVTKFSPVVNEFNISNTRGTLSFAKQGGNPDSATSDFFFNLADNSSNLDNQNGGFTVFAEITSTSGLNAIDSVAAKQLGAVRNEATGTPAGQLQDITGLSGTALSQIPINGTTGLTGTTAQAGSGGENAFVITGGFTPARDLVIIRRAAPLLKIASV